jgi:glycosyltransferase involved in cell wall biosynthesis
MKDGLLIEPDNAKELKKAILTLIKNQDLKARLRENSRKKALLFDINKSVAKYQDLYMSVAAK